jgi:hypothetical protein
MLLSIYLVNTKKTRSRTYFNFCKYNPLKVRNVYCNVIEPNPIIMSHHHHNFMLHHYDNSRRHSYSEIKKCHHEIFLDSFKK